MPHSLPPTSHSRLARSVVKRALVERAGGGGQSPAAMQAAAERAAWSNHVSEDLNIALALGVALLFLVFAPLAATWVANNRFSTGWFLSSVPVPIPPPSSPEDEKRGQKGKAAAAGSSYPNEKKGKSAFDVVPIIDRPLPLRIAPVSALFAHIRTLYNRTLLPTSFLFGLTWGQVCVCLVYEAVVMFCLFYKATDQQTDWKRSGAVSTAQLPAVFLFATKNNALSIIGKGYEKLNYLHRVAGRLAIFCGLLHTLLFLLKSPVDWTKPTHVTGVVCAIACAVLFLTSISYFRRAFYQVFLVSHIAGWITLVVGTYMHVSDFAKPYIAFALAVYCADVLLRIAKTRLGSASIVALPGGMTMLQSHGVNSGWRPGQHVWLRVAKGWRGWETHPFTVANAPRGASPLEGSHNLTLLVKSCGDWTRGVNSHAVQAEGGFGRRVKCAIEGPYGGPMFTDFCDAQSAVLFAGGSGITFAASTLEELVFLAQQGQLRTRTVTLVWVFKELECVEWYQAFFAGLMDVAREQTCLNVRILLHVTNPPTSAPLDSPIPFTSLRHGRPSPSILLNTVVDEVLDSVKRKCLPRGGGIAVGTCGPKPLVEQVRQAVSGIESARAVGAGGITSYSETFGW
ncbi:hypothetical protein JCM6882_002293 [Rhodosporidiobolus microsporus]